MPVASLLRELTRPRWGDPREAAPPEAMLRGGPGRARPAGRDRAEPGYTGPG